MQPRSLFRRFRLKLITSSHACERGVAEVPRTANQVFGDSDAMGVSTNTPQVGLIACACSPTLLCPWKSRTGTTAASNLHQPPLVITGIEV